MAKKTVTRTTRKSTKSTTTTKKPSTERTSQRVAALAGAVLKSKRLREAEQWLQGMDHPLNVGYAKVLLKALASLRSIAASALTQR